MVACGGQVDWHLLDNPVHTQRHAHTHTHLRPIKPLVDRFRPTQVCPFDGVSSRGFCPETEAHCRQTVRGMGAIWRKGIEERNLKGS